MNHMRYKSTETDSWLESLGYYRKHIAYDETCLFRSVAEQIYKTQMFHEVVRKECIEYADNNRDEFDQYVDDWDEYLMKLKNHMVICGEREVKIISQCYRCDIIIFDGAQRVCKYYSENNYGKYILLSLINEDHFDTVYKIEFIKNAGFCQSIVYNLLYENVFQVKEVNTIVDTMLYNKPENRELIYEESKASDEKFLEQIQNPDENDSKDAKLYTPFPFKVAKALDPDMYRNIEFDTWNEFRKEWRMNNWYYGDENFKVGTCCTVVLKNNNNSVEYTCYIQKLNPCVIYIEKLAVYKEVSYDKLKPLPDAKPWMLPYRYMKSAENFNITQESIQKKKKRRCKKKKKNQENKENEMYDFSMLQEYNNISAYEGYPLNMTRNNDNSHRNLPRYSMQSDIYLNNYQTMNCWQHDSIPMNSFPMKPYEQNMFCDNNYYYNQMWPDMKPLCPQMFMGQTIQSQYNMYSDNLNNFTYFSKYTTKETIGIQQPYLKQNHIMMSYMSPLSPSFIPPHSPSYIPPPSPSYLTPHNSSYMSPHNSSCMSPNNPVYMSSNNQSYMSPPSPSYLPPPSPPFICPPPSPQSLGPYSPLPFSPGSPFSPMYTNRSHFIFPPINGCGNVSTNLYN